MRVAINSTSLDEKNNISGVSSIVKAIVENNKGVSYIHVVIGKADDDGSAFLKRLFTIAGSYFNILKLLTGNRFDLLHLNIALYRKSLYRDVVTFTLCRIFRKKIVLHLHGGAYILKKPGDRLTIRLIRHFLNKADKVIVLSELEQQMLREFYQFRDAAILPNAVDTSIFKPGRKKDCDIISFLFLGRLDEPKGTKLLIPAFERLYNKGYPVKLVVCGNGPLKHYIEESTKNNPAIEYRGIVSGKQKIEAINECDVFVLPSYHEGLPMALLETMACGLVPVVTEAGSMKYVIQDGVNGLLVDIGDEAKLVEAMGKVVKNKQLREDISKNAVVTITEHYNWDNYLAALNNLYAEALAK